MFGTVLSILSFTYLFIARKLRTPAQVSDPEELRDIFIALEKTEDNLEEVAKWAREMAERLEAIDNDLPAYGKLQSIFVNEGSIREVLHCLKMVKYTKWLRTQAQIGAFSFLVENFVVHNEKLKKELPLEYVLELKAAFIRALSMAVTDDAICHLYIAIGNMTGPKAPELQKIFADPAIRDGILKCLPFAKHPRVAQEFGYVVIKICFSNDKGKAVFATQEVRDAVLSAFPLASTAPKGVRQLVRVIAHLGSSSFPEGQKLFTTLEMRDLLVTSLALATEDQLASVGYAIGKLCTRNPEAKKLFSVPRVRDAFMSAFRLATNADAAYSLCFAIGQIGSSKESTQVGRQLFTTKELFGAACKMFDVENPPEGSECWICQGTAEMEDGRFLTSICDCRGTNGFVHTSCIYQWATRGNERCQTCKVYYAFTELPGWADFMKPLQEENEALKQTGA